MFVVNLFPLTLYYTLVHYILVYYLRGYCYLIVWLDWFIDSQELAVEITYLNKLHNG